MNEYNTNNLSDFIINTRPTDGKQVLYKYTGNDIDIVIPDGVNIIMSHAFYDVDNKIRMDSFRSIYIPDSVEDIDEGAFSHLKGLEKINLPKNENFITIEHDLFGCCESLRSIEIPDGVKRISGSAFWLSGLEAIELPDSVEFIENHAFYLCDNLKYITIGKKCKHIAFNVFGNPDEKGVSYKTIIFYPDSLESMEAFKDLSEKIKVLPLSEKENLIANQSNDGCYIATCVYGSYDCPEVWTLRRFRDNILSKRFLGRMFVKYYYAVSPTIVKLFGGYSWFHKLFKPHLDKLVIGLQNQGVENTPYNDK